MISFAVAFKLHFHVIFVCGVLFYVVCYFELYFVDVRATFATLFVCGFRRVPDWLAITVLLSL